MATIYAKNKLTGEWERVGPAAAATDATLTLSGSPADAKVTGEAIRQVQDRINGLTAEDVGALPADTVIPSIEGLASETYVDKKISVINTSIDNKYKAINKKISSISKTITEQDIDTAFNDIFGGE